MHYEVVDAQISPTGRLEVLSRAEVNNLLDRDDWLSSSGSFTPNRNFVLYYSYKF